MSEEIRKTCNHAVLKKHDQCLDRVIFTSPICDIYKFKSTEESWEKVDCKGITPALRSIMSGNKPMEVDLQDATIMVQANPDTVYGLWLFEELDRPRVTSLIQWCITNGTP